MSKKNQELRRCYGCIIGGFFVTTIFLLLMIWLGMYPRDDPWERYAIKSSCLVKNQSFVENNCTAPQGFLYNCYNGYLNLQHTVKNVYYEATIQIVFYNYLNNTLEEMSEYPIGSTIKCWYNRAKPENVRLRIEDPWGYIGFTVGVIVSTLLIFLGLAWKTHKDSKKDVYKELLYSDYPDSVQD